MEREVEREVGMERDALQQEMERTKRWREKAVAGEDNQTSIKLYCRLQRPDRQTDRTSV